MDTSEIIAKLEKCHPSSKEHPQSQEAREAAIWILSSTTDVERLLYYLLSKVLRPLFSKQQHPNLTATGRKKLVPDAPIASRHSSTIDWNDELKVWRNSWSCTLLAFILSQYHLVPSERERSTFEAQFHLLVPPILNLIDDGDIAYKAQGCKMLRLLCVQVMRCQSNELKRTGLGDVFADALSTNFMHLPTLTPEDESLTLLLELYPAFRALVDACFPSAQQQKPLPEKEKTVLTLRPATNSSSARGTVRTAAPTTALSPAPACVPDTKDKDARQAILDLVLRHGVLASYAHAVDYVRLTTFLLHEACLLVSMMGIYSAKYLQTLLPLLREVLSNPFGTACVPLLMSALECMDVLIKICWPRIREKWWGECLRGIVGCWVHIEDDEDHLKKQELEGVQCKLREVTKVLEEVVGEDFQSARKTLVDEDETITGLFDDKLTNSNGIQGVS